MELALALGSNVVVVTILAALGVGDLYRQRQLSRYRIVIYPRRKARV